MNLCRRGAWRTICLDVRANNNDLQSILFAACCCCLLLLFVNLVAPMVYHHAVVVFILQGVLLFSHLHGTLDLRLPSEQLEAWLFCIHQISKLSTEISKHQTYCLMG